MNKYSIILPLHNGGEYVKHCVNSILSQTISDFDLLILDNLSTDGSAEWIKSLNDSRIKLFLASHALTIEENWARIKNIQKSEFITLIGHDDVLYPNYLATMNDLIAKHPNASLYQTHFNYIDDKGKEIRKCLPMDEVQTLPEFLAAILLNTIDIMGTGFMMRAKDYDSIGGISQYPNLLFADFKLWMELTSKNHKATSFNECFSYRKHLSTTALSSDTKMQQAFGMFVNYLEKLKSENINLLNVIERYSEVFIKRNCKGLSHRLLRTPKSKRNNLSVTSFLQECKEYANKLNPRSNYNPLSDYSVKLASQIDSNMFTRTLFLVFKKIYSKPILS